MIYVGAAFLCLLLLVMLAGLVGLVCLLALDVRDFIRERRYR